jgi:hypothetical protein
MADEQSQAWWDELKSTEMPRNWCCRLIIEAGLEGIVAEDPTGKIHRLKANYCPHCGRKI